MNELKSILITFSKTELSDFYQKGYVASQQDDKPDFYLPLLKEVVKSVCDEQGFDFEEVCVNDDANATA